MNGTVLNYPETPSSSAPGRAGGEKTKSEWEELESLTKDELIIELVRMRTLYRILRSKHDEDYYMPLEGCRGYYEENTDEFILGEPTTHEWAKKVALYGAMHPKDGAFFSCDLMDYGLTECQADEICTELRSKGLLRMPEGIEYEPDGDGE